MSAKYPGLPTVINGNGAVAHVMDHVCGGVIGYPITPSTEISELYESFRASGGVNVWGKHPFFYEPEGEHSAQSGALGAALTGGKYISNASSSQGILYALESHYVTVGKKVGGFVLHVAARVVSKHSLNVMAGHDDVYALLSSGYTILFGANPQEAADFAALSYKVATDSLIPVANAMDGFATSHMMSEARLPEPELLREFLGDPAGRMPAPSVAQEILFGAKGRVHQLTHWLNRHADAFRIEALAAARNFLEVEAERVETDSQGVLVFAAAAFVPENLRPAFRRQWLNAWEKGTRQRVPALVDVNNPGLTGGVQNQPDFQSGAVDHRTHFVADVPRFVTTAMDDYAKLTGRAYAPVMTWGCDDAETVLVGLGSVTEDAEAVAAYLRAQGRKVGVVAIKQLQPFPAAELVAALAGKRAVTVLERSEVTALTGFVTQALCKARENADGARHAGIPAIDRLPKLTTAIFGLGGHDLQPRHLVAAFDNMDRADSLTFVYLGTQFFSQNPGKDPQNYGLGALETRLAAAYPDTKFMALQTGENPQLLPEGAMRIRFHSIGGYGTIATGKLVTDILAGLLGLFSKSAPKYGSEKSGAPTNFYITLSPEPVKITNAELEDVEIVVSPDHKVFAHTDPLKGLIAGGTFFLQSSLPPLQVWHDLPKAAREAIRARRIRFFVIDAFAVAARHAPSPELATRMMGIAFIGALSGNVDRIAAGADQSVLLDKVRQQISKKFGAKGDAVVAGNMAVISEGLHASIAVPYDEPDYAERAPDPLAQFKRDVGISKAMCGLDRASSPSGLFDPDYYEEIFARPMRDDDIGESPVMPGTGLFMPAASAAAKDKGLFRRQAPMFVAENCTGCLECTLVCPDAAMPCTVHEIDDLLQTALRRLTLTDERREALARLLPPTGALVRERYRKEGKASSLHDIFVEEAGASSEGNPALAADVAALAEQLALLPVSHTSLFFDQMERKSAGSGGLFSVGVDPWKCTGCMECITVCGAKALIPRNQDEQILEDMQARFEFLSQTANSPARFTEGQTGANAKRLILDRDNYYASTGGHGACRGCGEVTAIRQITAAAHAIHSPGRKTEISTIESLLGGLAEKRLKLADQPVRLARIEETVAVLEKRLFDLEGGPTGAGPSPMVIANATGCSSVYCSTFPFNSYRDPWVNSLFQDAPALAKGLFEGLAADMASVVKAARIAELEIADSYEPGRHDRELRTLAWEQFTEAELARIPTVISMGGDGANYDIGFGALSKLLTTHAPVKVVILNTGAYSNTGGQASSSSFLGQDADLARVGAVHSGKQDDRKELGLIAAFHPKVMVVQTTPSMQGHFLKNVLAALTYTDGPVVLDIYTPCQGENGIGDEVSSRHAKLAVSSRTNPLFVHDPNAGANPKEWFSLHGNPNVEEDWALVELVWDDASGVEQKMDVPFTPADFALQEGRFKQQFKAKPLAEAVSGVPIYDYVDLSTDERIGVTPFVWKVVKRKLLRIPVPPMIVKLVEERRRHWRTLQHLAGFDLARLDNAHREEINALKERYEALSGNLLALARSVAPVGRADVMLDRAAALPAR